ncbi:hypothetical protein ElyMa_000544200 [Elysia marginata]|uniref:Uncharacterized protein n=1 Tax=Elysia marginata TaxID=1093978 RepID=A0AAV4G0C0_9GAST|nr:hypothetical protein ElyMa_000544200 [Elysia marginata]
MIGINCYTSKTRALLSIIPNPGVQSSSSEILALEENSSASRPLQAGEESPDFLESSEISSASAADSTSLTTVANIKNTAASSETKCLASSDDRATNRYASSNVNKSCRNSSSRSSNSGNNSSNSKTKTSTKGQKDLSDRKTSKSSKINTAVTTISTTVGHSSSPISGETKAYADSASRSGTTGSATKELSSNRATIAATQTRDNDSATSFSEAGVNIISTATTTAATNTSTSTSSSNSSSINTTSGSSGGSSSSTSASGLSNMSAMDLLMQLDLPTVSDSSDTEDFLQELAAINDSGLLRATMESLECGRLTPLIKEELRCRIQSRRLSEGKDELFVEFPSPTPSQVSPSHR